jgi:hypothetical protein
VTSLAANAFDRATVISHESSQSVSNAGQSSSGKPISFTHYPKQARSVGASRKSSFDCRFCDIDIGFERQSMRASGRECNEEAFEVGYRQVLVDFIL